MDGVDVSEQHQGGTFIQTSIDALQEFSVIQSPYSAEYNRGGAFFNATTKPGTNRYPRVYLSSFCATTRLMLAIILAHPASQKRNQFGGNIGGPLSIPHLYKGRDRTLLLLQLRGTAAALRLGEQHYCAVRCASRGQFLRSFAL